MISNRVLQYSIWSLRKIGAGTLISLLLLMVMLWSVAFGLEEIARIQNDTSLVLITTLGLFAGWLAARTSIPGWLFGILSVFMGMLFVVIHALQIGLIVLALFNELFRLVLKILIWHPGFPMPDLSVLRLLLIDILSGIVITYERLFVWLIAILSGVPKYNSLAATLMWGFLVWAISVWTGWAIRRRYEPLFAVLPGITLLAIGMAFSRINSWFLVVSLSSALFLLAWVNFSQRKDYWDRVKIDYAEDINIDIFVWTSAVVISLVSLALVLSFISPQKVLKHLRELGQSRSAEVAELGESLGIERPTEEDGDYTGGLPLGELPREHLLGAGPELSREVVMIIKTKQTDLDPSESSTDEQVPAYHWRALTYDLYTGNGWATSATYEASYPPDTPLAQIDTVAIQPLEQKVQVLADIGNYIFAVGDLISVDQDYRVSWRIELEDIFEPQPADMFSAYLTKSGSYQVKSIKNVAGITQLEAAGKGYPPWISKRYLQVPESLPQRVIDLAMEITSNKTTPYGKAKALEDYLRQIPYSLDVPAPPENLDVVDFFLFELERGYCDYYASSMAIMGRIVGLPTRLVIGYASGVYDISQDRYVVTAKDAHSWVEVYFPEIGWIEFEPTGGFTSFQYPENFIMYGQAETISPSQPKSNLRLSLFPWLVWSILVLGILFILYITWIMSDAWRLSRISPNTATITLYRRLFRRGRDMRINQEPNQTPHEFTEELNLHINNLTSPSWWQKRWQDHIFIIQQESQILVNLYTQTIYSSIPPDHRSVHKAIKSWMMLRRRLWLATRLNNWQAKKE